MGRNDLDHTKSYRRRTLVVVIVTLPLEYGLLYCIYMTVDGALYHAGLEKSVAMHASRSHPTGLNDMICRLFHGLLIRRSEVRVLLGAKEGDE